MVCLVCARFSRQRLCAACRLHLAPGGERRLTSGLLVRSAFRHDGAARILVHRLKYQGVRAAARVLAEAMVGRLPEEHAAVAPVRRVVVRAWRYGIDPGLELARALGALTGMPVCDVLKPLPWTPAHAGAAGGRRGIPRFFLRADPPCRVVLVDDVLTTGSTLAGAQAAVGPLVRYGVTATVAGRVAV